MYEVHCIDIETNNDFIKVFWNTKTLENFKRRCTYSKRIRIISIKDNSKYYD